MVVCRPVATLDTQISNHHLFSVFVKVVLKEMIMKKEKLNKNKVEETPKMRE